MTGQILDVFHPAQYVDARNCMLVALERAQTRGVGQMLCRHDGDGRLCCWDCNCFPNGVTVLLHVSTTGEVFAP